MKKKPKFPIEYYTIAKVDGVSDKIVKEYRKIIRHELYVERKERRLRAFSYGELSDVEYLMPNEEPDFDKPAIRNEALADALESLKASHESWYAAVIDYYFCNEKISFSDIALKYGVTKPEARRRVMCGLRFLREKMKQTS